MADNTGAICVRCGKGHYKVLDLNDDIFGELHCSICGHYVKLNQDLGELFEVSSDTQAVRDAANLRHGCTPSAIAAGALLAVADQLLIRPDVERSEYSTLMRLLDRKFRAIAAELEGNP